jgi:carbon storage regulator CsrA
VERGRVKPTRVPLAASIEKGYILCPKYPLNTAITPFSAHRIKGKALERADTGSSPPSPQRTAHGAIVYVAVSPTFNHQEWRPLILVLCRRHNERIVLSGQDIIIEVLSVKGNTVRRGITAPADVKAMREELLVQCVAPSPVVSHVL